MTNAWESLHFAMLELVRSAPIKQRLVGAFRKHLVCIRPDQLPAEVRDTFGHIMTTLDYVKPLPGEDGVAASVRKMSPHDADECAALIVEVYGVTCRALIDAGRHGAAPAHHHEHAATLNRA